MTETTELDTLQRENDTMRDELRQVARERAAESVGLPPDMARWISGDTLEEAKADATKLADQVSVGQSPGHAPSSEAQAIQQHFQEQHDRARSMSGGDQQEEN